MPWRRFRQEKKEESKVWVKVQLIFFFVQFVISNGIVKDDLSRVIFDNRTERSKTAKWLIDGEREGER